MRRKIHGFTVFMIVLCIVLAITCGAVIFLCRNLFLQRNANREKEQQLQVEKTALEQENVKLKEELSAVQLKVAEQQLQISSMEQAEEVAEGQLSPSAGNSIFSQNVTVQAGTVLNPEQIEGNIDRYFTSAEIVEGDEIYNRIIGKSYQVNDYVALSDLRYLTMLHYNFDHQIQVGEMIVNAKISEDVLGIFREFFDTGYEINSMRLIDDYWTGDGTSSDNESINNNNTSCFCYREVTGGASLSNHAYGLAIDINPQQNPYVWLDEWGQEVCYHDNARQYVDRSCGDPHVVVEGDTCYSIFEKYGFSWGGQWSYPIDYQHFEKTVF